MQPVPSTDVATYFNHDRMQAPPSPPPAGWTIANAMIEIACRATVTRGS